MAKKYHNNKNVTVVFDVLVSYFTGCDSVSAFSGKVKLLKIPLSNDEFNTTFQILGSSWELPEDFITRSERFVCSMVKQPIMLTKPEDFITRSERFVCSTVKQPIVLTKPDIKCFKWISRWSKIYHLVVTTDLKIRLDSASIVQK